MDRQGASDAFLKMPVVGECHSGPKMPQRRLEATSVIDAQGGWVQNVIVESLCRWRVFLAEAMKGRWEADFKMHFFLPRDVPCAKTAVVPQYPS